jgi:hypothetical protein
MLAVQYIGKDLSSIFGSKIKNKANLKVCFRGGEGIQYAGEKRFYDISNILL